MFKKKGGFCYQWLEKMASRLEKPMKMMYMAFIFHFISTINLSIYINCKCSICYIWIVSIKLSFLNLPGAVISIFNFFIEGKIYLTSKWLHRKQCILSYQRNFRIQTIYKWELTVFWSYGSLRENTKKQYLISLLYQ